MQDIDKYRTIADDIGLGKVFQVERIKKNNNIDRVVTSDGIFYCKTYTKSWYGPAEENWYPVHHESGAYSALKANGLNTPEVIHAELSATNPLGMPYLLLRALEGKTICQHLAEGSRVDPLLQAAGRYLRAMHAIEFEYPGYVTSPDGPTEPPNPEEWRHGHWSSDVLETAAKSRWQDSSNVLGSDLHERLLEQLESNREAFEADYNPPRMLHGDCHVSQFFFKDDVVTGVVDLEVASSGSPIGDLIKFSIEASSKLREIAWWIPLFHGYGQEPNFGVFKLRLLCCEYAEFRCQSWQGTYPDIIKRLDKAESWHQLFHCSQIDGVAQRGAATDVASRRR
jgi:aminoglycoside phosphotransferase